MFRHVSGHRQRPSGLPEAAVYDIDRLPKTGNELMMPPPSLLLLIQHEDTNVVLWPRIRNNQAPRHKETFCPIVLFRVI